MLHITEDTPVDMLTGAMDLTVHLPNGRSVKMSVKRSTPMMDLLMQISTKYNLQLSDHTLQALSMAPSPDNIDRLLPFKPNTPIGLIDTQNIKVLPKPKMVKNKMAPQPFESTFRLKVHLPRNQLYVTRVSKFVLLEDILKKACLEKALDPKKYALHHPGNLDEVLDPKLTLNDYQITEVYLVAKGTVNLNQVFSASDLMVLRKEEERKRMQAKTGGGVLSLIFGKKQSGMGSGSLSSENRSISPSHSDDSRSVTPPAIPNQIIAPQIKEPEKPKPPQRKRRPAPKPPTVANVTSESRKNSDANPPSSVSDSVEIREGKSDNSLTICHSRNSSDSSGYHEASILSDNCNTSLPRRPQSAYVSNRDADSLAKMRHSMSHSTTNLSKMSAHSKSTSSLAFPGRKKKAAPPPPPSLKSSASVTNLVAPSPVVASQNTDSLTSNNFQTPLDSLASHLTHSEDICTKTEEPEPDTSRTPPELPANPPPKILLQKKEVKKEVVEEAKSEPEEIKVEVLKPEVEVVSEDTVDKVNETEEPKEVDWQYQLPPPPEGFRDASSIADATINDATIPDSVVTSPELFETLKAVEDTQSEPATVASSTISEDENPLLNNLSLENLEKRKSLVYNRELATSLKMTDGPETFTTSLNKFESTYEEIKRSSLTTTEPKQLVTVKRSTSTLPNFKITPYNNPKKNITVFEDDTIRSNTYIKNNVTAKKETNLSKSYVGRSMENISFRKNSWENQSDDDKSRDTNYNVYRPNQNMKFKNALANSLMYRSESFSSDNHGPIKPVSRSKSTLTLNKYKEDKKECTSLENRSNSLLDVSGLQSLEVMKSIQNRLNTSVENINKQETSQLKSVKPEEIQPEPPKVYHYRSPPSINLGTWSERPKAPISVKEDVDYNVSSKLIVNTTNNNITSNNSIEVNNKPNSTYSNNGSVNVRVGGYQPSEPKHVTIKVNGTEPISTEKSGNVVIKIGSCKPLENQKFVSYRKPLGNINKIQTQRPHSIAFDDLSHVPVVRSVELKKPYKDMTSITQINQVNEPKPVSRVNSFTPVVRGFKRPENMNTPRNRLSWNPPNPNIFDLNKPKDYESYSTNKDVPFSQSNLRRTDSKKILNSDAKTNLNNQKNSSYNSLIQKKPEVMQTPPPPPPSLPKFEVKKPRPRQIEPKEDPRDLLLDSIRNFGGKKGLKSIKG